MKQAMLPQAREHVLSARLDPGDGVLIDLETKRYYVLNETAMFVWRAIEGRVTRENLIQKMTEDYDVTNDHAASSTARLLAEFSALGLVESARADGSTGA